jgi:hypothetical protein
LVVEVVNRFEMHLSLETGLSCNLTGFWNYAPESGTSYSWRETASGAIGCFDGTDIWKRGSASVSGSNVSLVFGDPACFGGGAPPAGFPITKWGLLNDACDEVVMHDVQPNCPVQGLCKYRKAPPPPPPCPSLPSGTLDVTWLECRTRAIIHGCEEGILPTSKLNQGINASDAYTPDATHSYGAQWTRDFAYTVAGAAELLDEEQVKRSIRYTFAGQRADGCMPDRVQVRAGVCPLVALLLWFNCSAVAACLTARRWTAGA